MAIGVIAIHTKPVQNEFVNSVLFFAVSFFFITSGYFAGKCGNVKKQLFKIIKMYVVWSAIYFPLACYGIILNGTTFSKAVLVYMRNFLFVGQQYNSWHLWYLLSSIFGLLVLYIHKRFKLPKYALIIWTLLVIVFSFFVSYLSSYNGDLSVFIIMKKIVSITILNGRVLQGMYYIPLGYLIEDIQIDKWWYLIFSVVSFGLWVIYKEYFIIGTLLFAICSLSVFGLIKSIELKDHIVYSIMRTMSTNIFLVHMYVWTVFYMIVYRTKTFGIVPFLATTIISILIAYIWYLINLRNKEKKLIHK